MEPSTKKEEIQDPVEHSNNNKSPSYTEDLVKFLLRKDLTLSRLYIFNDKPETWKSSFSQVMKEMSVNPSEEMDLLVKWLGVESRKFALSIRSANTHDPGKGLKRIWERLDERFGSPEMVHSVIIKKLHEFPKIGPKDIVLYELSDILTDIESLKEDPKYANLLAYFDSSVGVSPVVAKLPYNLQEKWTTRASTFKRVHSVTFPSLWVLTKFIQEQAKIRNDPGFMYSTVPTSYSYSDKTANFRNRPMVASKKTEVNKETNQTVHEIGTEKSPNSYDPSRCPIHKANHALTDCRVFMNKSLDEKKKFLKDGKLCFKCCASVTHKAGNCKSKLLCSICGKDTHVTAMHDKSKVPDQSGQGGEETFHKVVASKCTDVCGKAANQNFGKSCAKLVLVKVYQNSRPDQFLKTYAILDEQSNRSLARPEFFSKLKISSEKFEYTLKTCSDTVVMSGRRAVDCVIESLDGSKCYQLPTVIECTNIPILRDEIPTPQVAMHHTHLQDIAYQIPELDREADILLLIGRDLIDVHHILDQKTGPPGSPYAQRLGLGWVVTGEVCLGKVHQPESVITNKTYLISKDRESVCQPCPNSMQIKESGLSSHESDLFVKTSTDEKVGLSTDDREFMQLMDKEFRRDSSGSWIAPLPFKSSRQKLPNNREQALHRARSLDASLRKNPLKRDHFVTFMKEILDSGHAETAPPLKENTECWYLPLFGVYHPKKPTQIRGVFDASARYHEVSLNDILLTGPDLTNSLLGVLLRFRKEPVAITAEIFRKCSTAF